MGSLAVDLLATQRMKNGESFLEYIPILCKNIRSLREEVFLILLYSDSFAVARKLLGSFFPINNKIPKIKNIFVYK